MARTERSNNFWMVFLVLLLFVCGFLAIGYYQTYDLKCAGNVKVWVWKEVPPKFKCPL